MNIGVVGYKQSGKDTIAEYLVRKYKFTKYAFADPIKRTCQEMFGFTDEQCWGKLKEVTDKYWGVKPRKVLQIFGVEITQYYLQREIPELNKIGKYFWFHRFLMWYNKNKDKNIVISDVRFPHEVAALRKLEFKIIKVNRKNIVCNDKHISETEIKKIKDFDFLVHNDGTKSQLHKNISIKMEKWLL